jgi:uncharacterized membrane protein
MERRKSFAPFLFSGTLALLGIAVAATCDKLPDRLATHFGASGIADGWMDKSSFLTLFIATSVGLGVLAPLLFRLIRWLPAGAINLPNAAYWLSPEQRSGTFRYLSDWGFVIGAWTAGFQTYLYLLIVRANHAAAPTLSPTVWIGTCILVGAVLAQLIRLYSRFSKVPAEGAPVAQR